MNHVPATARGLGRAGLLPFIAAPALLAALPAHRELICQILAHYALGIVAFLLGIWWGLGLVRRNAGALVMSNAIFLAAFAGRSLLADPLFLVLAAVILCITLVVERSHALFRPQPPYYARMRLELTAVAAIALLLSGALAVQTH